MSKKILRIPWFGECSYEQTEEGLITEMDYGRIYLKIIINLGNGRDIKELPNGYRPTIFHADLYIVQKLMEAVKQ